MSSRLWEFFLCDDVASFQRYLAGSQRAPGPGGGLFANSQPGSPGTVTSSSLGVPPKPKRSTGTSSNLSRDELNARDQYGNTLLHHIASSPRPTAVDFALTLLEVPHVDIYAQDLESGWTALHRALYAGNATIAQALMVRDAQDATDLSKPGALGHPSGSLIKIKDREGYSPFDVYMATINPRDIKPAASSTSRVSTLREAWDDTASVGSSDEGGDMEGRETPGSHWLGDEIYTFGSNKNLNLGVGDQDDRQFPERITLKRPEHLLERLYQEYQEKHEDPTSTVPRDSNFNQDLPAFIKAKPIKFRTIAMSKLHTAILTSDPESNLFMCGFGPGGRLGTGDEATRFSFVCIEGGGLANKKVVSIALGQDHTLAITDKGNIFSWGSNKFGQLGYGLPRTSNKDDVPIQPFPRQIFNPFKKEVILGAAASAIHSVVFSSSGLYTFGKNEGQLGLVDSDARSLEIQTTPRRVGASLFSAPIHSVSAIDQATAILLQNHEVWVFSHYGYTKLSFPLEANSRFIKESFMTTRYDTSLNRIVKIRTGGSTICALSSSGDVFTAHVDKLEHLPSLTSTTNPSKIRNSLSAPARVWSVKKAHMAVKDVDVGQDGSIIICTNAGSAWRKEKRRKTKGGPANDYKFARVPGLSRVVGVCSNAFGAFAAAQRECHVTREQINVVPTKLWDDIFPLSPFHSISTSATFDFDETGPWNTPTAIRQAIMGSSNLESYFPPTAEPPRGTIWVMTTTSSIRVPVHEFILAGRSTVLRKAFHEFRSERPTSMPELLTIEKDKAGKCQMIFQGFDIWVVLNIAFFLYSDNVFDVWHQARYSPEYASRYRQVRTEVMRVATQLNLPSLERAAILMVRPVKSIKVDFAMALNDPAFYESADVVIDLNDDQMTAHSQVICQRCPFFDTLFHGRSGGFWLQSRRRSPEDKIHVDLKHIDRVVFEFVLRYMYTDADDRLFDEVRTRDTEELIDLIIDVAFVADELMIDRLAQICQNALGKFVTSRNVCQLLNAVAPCFVTGFKDAALEYICLNLEDLISNKLLGELDENLLRALDHVCHDNQLAAFPISRGRNLPEYILEKYPELVSSVQSDKRRRVDSMRLRSRVGKLEMQEGKFRTSNEKPFISPSVSKLRSSSENESPVAAYNSPSLKPKLSAGDLMFQMDDEQVLSPVGLGKGKAADRGNKTIDENDFRPWNDTSGLGNSLQGMGSFGNRSYLDDQMASSQDHEFAKSPSGFQTRGGTNGSLSPPHVSQAPWSSPVISSRKKPLKDIMTESSEVRVSNLSLGMSARRESSGTFAPKLSQKERKKIQQQQLQEKATAQEKAKNGPQNPWKVPTQAGTSASVGPPPNAKLDLPTPTPPKSVQRPGMTLRQTVAGAPSPKSSSPAPSTHPKGRSTSATAQPHAKGSYPGPSTTAPSTSPNQPPTIQSVRHLPRPEPYKTNFHSDSSSSLSLATILLQQQTEKDEIREAATAKHNLQDIQAEQAFQEWWDKESRRVQGLPEPEAEAGPATGPDGPDDRGDRSGRKNKGIGQRKKRGKGPQAEPGSTASPQSVPRSSIEPTAALNGSAVPCRPEPPRPSPLHSQTQKKPRVDSTPTSSRRGGRGDGGYRGKQSQGEKA